MDAKALLAHVIAQTRQNIQFLTTQNQISPADEQDILRKLPQAPRSTPPPPQADLVHQAQNLAVTPPAPSAPQHPITSTTAPFGPGPVTSSQHPPPYSPPTLQDTVLFRAKALWDYNVDVRNPGDLSFRAGETIDVLAETNADWWTGALNSEQGLFPSGYVEKLVSIPQPPVTGGLTSPLSSSSSYPQTYLPPRGSPGYSVYQPPSGPPPGHGGYPSYGPPATAPPNNLGPGRYPQ